MKSAAAEATLTQSLPDWIGTHVRALAFMGSVPAQLVPDNPKPAKPEPNRSFERTPPSVVRAIFG